MMRPCRFSLVKRLLILRCFCSGDKTSPSFVSQKPVDLRVVSLAKLLQMIDDQRCVVRVALGTGADIFLLSLCRRSNLGPWPKDARGSLRILGPADVRLRPTATGRLLLAGGRHVALPLHWRLDVVDVVQGLSIRPILEA